MRRIALGLLMVAVLGAISVPAHAGRPGSAPLTGTIELVSPARLASSDAAWPKYGDAVAFRTSVSGSVSSKATVYVNVVCGQGGSIVFQSSGPEGTSFTLADQAGQGLEWNGEAADCIGSLVYREEKGRTITISYLAQDTFAVAG